MYHPLKYCYKFSQQCELIESNKKFTLVSHANNDILDSWSGIYHEYILGLGLLSPAIYMMDTHQSLMQYKLYLSNCNVKYCYITFKEPRSSEQNL